MDVHLLLRQPSEAPRRSRSARGRGTTPREARPAPLALDAAANHRYEALKAWRAEVARARNLPAYIVFHDAALAEMARARPDSLAELGQVNGVGAKKLEDYGQDILRVLGGEAPA